MSYIITGGSSGSGGTQQFDTDSGTATPSGDIINILGGTGVDTTGIGNIVTVNVAFPIVPSVAQGDLLYGASTDTLTVLSKDTNATRYVSNTGASNNPAWAQIDLTNGVTGTLPVDNGGSGRASHTAYAVICGGTTSTAAQQSIASVGTTGQVLTSNGAGALPTFQASSGGGITWNEETGTSASMAVDNGYIANNASLVTLTLPDTAAVGEIVRVAGKGAGLFRVAQNASEVIHFGSSDTTTGVGGYIEATNRYDAVELICIVANTEWTVLSAQGNLTVV